MKPEDFRYISERVRERSAICLGEDKAYLVETRMVEVCKEEGLADIAELVVALKKEVGDKLEIRVVDAMTTNETLFFRDVQPFEVLREHVVPEIMERNANRRKLHIWCAACSSGQEPYSIALTLHEHFPELRDWAVSILATDISAKMTQRAAEGLYSQMEVNRGLPAPLLIKYFERSGAKWRIKDEISRLVEFRQLNLIDAWPTLPPADIVFIRNVLIYFDSRAKKQIVRKIQGLLEPKGYMFVGGAEASSPVNASFEQLQFGMTICFRLREE